MLQFLSDSNFITKRKTRSKFIGIANISPLKYPDSFFGVQVIIMFSFILFKNINGLFVRIRRIYYLYCEKDVR